MPEDILDLTFLDGTLSKNDLEQTKNLDWLYESYERPAAFWVTLKNTNHSFFPIPGKSSLFKKYDFFYDIIIRNQENTSPAFCWYDSVLGWKHISYTDLGVLASQKAESWARSGALAGEKICIVLPMGLRFVVALLAALKLGLLISLLPPSGRRFIKNRLEILSPEYIESEEIYFPLLKPWAEIILPELKTTGKSGTDIERSHVYDSGTPICLCFDPSSQTPCTPIELTSDTLYLCPMRDGILPLGMRPGESMAASGFHFLEIQPALILSTLLNGATYHHMASKDVMERPELLNDHPVRSMGLGMKLRDSLLRGSPAITDPWRCLFCNPAESNDLSLWQQLIKHLKIEDSFFMNLKWDAASGGCSLFSLKVKGKAHSSVLPSAGTRWKLCDTSGNDLVSFGNFGILSVETLGRDDETMQLTPSIISRYKNEWLYTGSHVRGRYGRYYPKKEILEAIESIPECHLSSIADLPDSQIPGRHRFVLLIFKGAEADIDEAESRSKIDSVIAAQLGDEFIPDRIEFFPLYPRRNEDRTIDHDWCQFQYVTGLLFNKSKDEMFQCVTRLRKYTFLQ